MGDSATRTSLPPPTIVIARILLSLSSSSDVGLGVFVADIGSVVIYTARVKYRPMSSSSLSSSTALRPDDDDMYIVVGGVVAPPPSVVDDVGMSDVLLRWRWLIGLLWRCCRAITVVNEGGERIGGGVRARKLLLLLGLLPLLVIYFLMILYRERRLLMPVIRDKLDEGYDTYDDFEEVVRDAERQGHGGIPSEEMSLWRELIKNSTGRS